MQPQYVSYMTIDDFKILLQESLKSLLNDVKKEIQESAQEKSDLVNIKVVMEKLQVTKPTIYNWIKKGIIRPQKIGGKVLFDLPVILNSMKMHDCKLRRGTRDIITLRNERER